MTSPTTSVPPTMPGSHLRSEIAEQPARWRDLITLQRETLDAAADLIRDAAPELIVFAARGSSDHAAQYGQYLTHNLLRIPAMLATPATASTFGVTLSYPRSVMLAVSQSGESPDLLETVRSAQDAGVKVIAFTNNDASTLASLSQVHVPLTAGPELSVAATKTYTAELLALYLVISRAAGTEWAELDSDVDAVAAAGESTILASTTATSGLAKTLRDQQRILVVGRGYSMSSAKEGALKLMETNAIAASGWSVADATHGPLGQVIAGTPVIVLAASPGGLESVATFSGAAADLGAYLIVIGQHQLGALSTAPSRIPLPELDALNVPSELVPLIEILPMQLLALALALERGLNPDQPAGLNKVTRTR
ncbi:SIS domain-containing protein [Cryobacterium soli]|uniref:SIS domain-containing protein n=1 Tax=Cryobacterium soli TaxID=2220095 RepID=UPI000E72A8AD|nr:SIS domain-containing protein [Cryobacterium soli]